MSDRLTHWDPVAELDVTEIAPGTRAHGGAPSPVCFVVDGDPASRNFASLVLQGYGIETGQFADARSLREGLLRRMPDLIFLDVPIEAAHAIEAVHLIGQYRCRGPLQLMSSRGAAVVETVVQAAQRYSLTLPPPLKKPIDRPAIAKVLQQQKLILDPVSTAKIGLDTALQGGWIEFWYQPKIDLRRKQLAGAETFARVRHPVHGMMSPSAFIDDTDDKGMARLTQDAIINALQTGLGFSKLGINLRLAVNVSVQALTRIPVEAIVREFRPKGGNWPGLLLDVTEDQIASDLPLVRDITATLARYGVSLAIDDFGRGFVPLARLKEIPFAELKLDRACVADCASNKSNAAMCKTVIDLAHNFGSVAVAVGVEKAADAYALTAMGCDLGQGFLYAQPMAEERFITLLQQRAERAQPSAAGC